MKPIRRINTGALAAALLLLTIANAQGAEPGGAPGQAAVAGERQEAGTPAAATAELFKAIRSGDDTKVARLLDEDPKLAFASDEQGRSALMFALYGQRTNAANLILARRAGNLTIFEAAAAGNDDAVRSLLKRNSRAATQVSADGFTALHLASYFGHVQAEALLLESGAEINRYSRNNLHATPLQSAAAARQLESARLLLAQGADPNCKGDGGYSPLHEAAATGQLELVRLLLQHKADRQAKGDDGKTPADVAAQEKQTAVLDLLRRGAN